MTAEPNEPWNLYVDLVGDAESDGEAITQALDTMSLDMGMSLEAYESYLQRLAGALRRRAAQVEEEAGL